jgi:putative ABC transport system ATP-binding protein
MTNIVELQEIRKTYYIGEIDVHALRGVSLAVQQGEYLAIMGPSGSGKSTMLNLLGCLDRPTSGKYLLGGEDVAQLSDDDLSWIRSAKLGFIFQSYNLIQQLTVVENIEIPLFYQGRSERESYEKARSLAETVGLGDRLDHRPNQLSGGQQQRVAIARALANDPLVLLADEPTGNLDSQTGKDILILLDNLHAEGKSIIVVTHDEQVAKYAERVIVLGDGCIAEERRGGR